jgi:hypothetical protein
MLSEELRVHAALRVATHWGALIHSAHVWLRGTLRMLLLHDFRLFGSPALVSIAPNASLLVPCT